MVSHSLRSINSKVLFLYETEYISTLDSTFLGALNYLALKILAKQIYISIDVSFYCFTRFVVKLARII